MLSSAFAWGVASLSMRSAVSHGTFFKMADKTVSDSAVIQIPAGENVQMKAQLILLRKLKGWGQILLPRKS